MTKKQNAFKAYGTRPNFNSPSEYFGLVKRPKQLKKRNRPNYKFSKTPSNGLGVSY